MNIFRSAMTQPVYSATWNCPTPYRKEAAMPPLPLYLLFRREATGVQLEAEIAFSYARALPMKKRHQYPIINKREILSHACLGRKRKAFGEQFSDT